MAATERAHPVACDHCGLPVPRGLVRADSTGSVGSTTAQFCCSGCEMVYNLLHEQGLERYYDLAEQDNRDSTQRPAASTDRSYGELDDGSFQERYCRTVGETATSVSLYLEGVHCTACVWLVEKLPRLLPGVLDARLELGRSMAEVVWDPARVSLSQIARTIDSLGYAVHPYRGADRLRLRRREERTLLIRMAVAGACAANVGLFAAALYAGLFGAMGGEFEGLFRWASLIVTLPAVLYAGQPFWRGALSSLRARSLHMDLPIAIGLGAGFGWGAVNTLRGRGEIYFDSVTALIFLLLIGRWVQFRQQRRAADATELLFSLTPSVARLVDAGAVREVPIDSLVPGCTVEVLAGDTFPVDGEVVDGRSTINTALLTGESLPEVVRPGAVVHAGTVNVSAPLRIVARATGEKTRVGRLMRHVEQQASRRAPIVLAADRIAGVFVASALALATVTLVAWLLIEPSRAMENAIALLIVTCPCALGLATPLAVSVAIGRAARRGILIKGGDTLERLAKPGVMLLDKTGTLTCGEQRLVRWTGSDATLARAAALEERSSHPLAQALVEAVSAPAGIPRQVHETLGGGIRGVVDDVHVVVASPAFAAANVGILPQHIASDVAEAASEGDSPVVIIEDGVPRGVASFCDPIRADVAPTLARLRARGWKLRLLSGDHAGVVRTVGARLGFAEEDCIGGATPEDKLAEVRRAAEQGRVVMVGDGVNDAAALAAATAGIAVHGSAEASLSSADVFVDRAGLAPVAELVEGARNALRVIHRNLGFSLAYNLVGATLAVTGIIHPLIAAIMMPISSLTVVTSSVKGRTFTPEKSQAAERETGNSYKKDRQ